MLYQATYDAFLGRLIEAREEANLTQREVSPKIGMSHSFLSKCKTGDRRIDAIEFLQLANLYSKPLAFFLVKELTGYSYNLWIVEDHPGT
jgi:transcriptional regulator with XRE-family HTH domain